ncbi:hypothetical protein DFH06DRAFT_1168555 [Mycena polygramma]|nr:hypothetical protein DFH06DRAFT_1168555 [Mycena polygramma]
MPKPGSNSKPSSDNDRVMRAIVQALDEMPKFPTESSKSPSASDRARMKPILKAWDKKKGKERPSKYTHRVDWNDFKYTCFLYTYPAMETQEEGPWHWQENTLIDQNLSIAQRTKDLMRVEGQLIALALENLVYGNFESEWGGLPEERKRELALEGLFRGSRCSPREISRVICPELAIDVLIGDGEYNLINLEEEEVYYMRLKRIMAHDPTGNRRVKELYLFVHPYVEHEYRYSDEAPDIVKGFLYHCLLLRNFCIADTLIGILEAYTNLPTPPMIPMKSYNRQHDEERESRKQRARTATRKYNLHKTVDGSQCREQKLNVVIGCSRCHKKAEPGMLKRCGRCQLLWYCSSACQKNDWPDHKKICGKEIFDPQLFAPTPEGPDEFIGCPTAADGYTRTPALWRQIWYLSKPDSQRSFYHFDTTPKHTRSIIVKNPPGAREVFLVARRRAMASGSVPAIHMMFTIIKYGEVDGVTIYDLTVDQIRRQFEMEYRIELTPGAIQTAEPFIPPTVEELKEEREFLQQRLDNAGDP